MNFYPLSSSALAISLLFASVVSPLSVTQDAVAEERPETISQLVAQKSSVLASGQFVNVEQNKPTTGSVRIVSENGKRYLELDNRFSTANGPDVFVILHRQSEIGPKVSEDDYINIGRLTSFQGSQRYEIPDDLKLEDVQSVGIWCRQFNVTFGYAALSTRNL